MLDRPRSLLALLAVVLLAPAAGAHWLTVPAPAAATSGMEAAEGALRQAAADNLADLVRIAHAQAGVARATDLQALGPSPEPLAVAQVVLGADAPAAQEAGLPSALVARLAGQHGVAAPADLARLDALAPAPRAALARALAAFEAFEAAAAQGALGPAVDAARVGLVAAGLELRAALAAQPANLELQLAPAVILDLDGGDDVHVADAALLIDDGGADVYLNNAGGSNLAGGTCTGTTQAAALLDLGSEGDRYGDGARGCGVNGGGYQAGAGFLLDVGGDDLYQAGHRGANGGGALLGSGFLADLGGDDAYAAGRFGTNGGGTLLGEDPFLLDAAARVHPYADGAEGGGASAIIPGGSGVLLDLGGADTYTAGDFGANGGAMQGDGRLVDLGGASDRYEARDLGSNGGAFWGARGFLYDDGGDELYLGDSDRDAFFAACCGINGGGYVSGVGLLYDGAGDDTYFAGRTAPEGHRGGRNGANAGTSLFGVGVLVDDGAGRDRYVGGVVGSNGGAEGGGISVLVDGGGDDVYLAAGYGTNGGGVAGVGQLIDRGGNDVYWAGLLDPALGGGATNGGVEAWGRGALIDEGGDDAYFAYGTTSNGAVGGLFLPGTALLLDRAGRDTYEDGFGACTDCSIVPKGLAGAQVDVPS